MHPEITFFKLSGNSERVSHEMSSEEIPECLSNGKQALNDLIQDVMFCVEKSSNASMSTGKPKHPERDEPICKEPECFSNRNMAFNNLVQNVFSCAEKPSSASSSTGKSKHPERNEPTCEEPKCLNNRKNALNDLVQDVMSCVEKTSNACTSTGKPKHPERNEPNFEEPKCLRNRKKALNDLILDVMSCVEKSSKACTSTCKPKHPKGDELAGKEPDTVLSAEKLGCECLNKSADESMCKDDAMNTLMCDFWKMMKDEPNFKEPDIRSQVFTETSSASCCGQSKPQKRSTGSDSTSRTKCIKVPIIRAPKKHDCTSAKRPSVPLQKALTDLKDAACFEKSCAEKVSELLTTQENLTEQIQNLEEQEKKGVALLQTADNMWSCMESQYKNQLEAKKGEYKTLLQEKKEMEAALSKWRRTLKDLEFKIKCLNNTSQEITTKKIQKANDIKVLNMEIVSYKKSIESNAKDLQAAKNSYTAKKKASEAKLKKLTDEKLKYQEKVCGECTCKETKETQGKEFLKEARDDLQKICRCLLQKKLENEDLRAEKQALLQEIELLKTTSDNCSERCARRQNNIAEETKRIDKEISDYKVRCMRCHTATDNSELMGFCVDCPRCVTERDCLIKGEECFTDHTKDCICRRVKDKFLDNVFENMYSVLEKNAKTCPGKEVADCIFTCLERSRNGKLDDNAKKILQDFILSTVKQNLNLTIIGGAVKTRCEMDPEMYNQLMLCLKDVTVTKPPKVDKETVPRKPPCRRWKETSECNCPRGPKACACTMRAPKPPTEPATCGSIENKEMECQGGTNCPVSSHGNKVRAAQCTLGSDALSKVRGYSRKNTNKKASRISGNNAVKSCHTDCRSNEKSRKELIAGVMGVHTEITPIEEVHVLDDHCEMFAASGTSSGCDCTRLTTQNKKKE